MSIHQVLWIHGSAISLVGVWDFKGWEQTLWLIPETRSLLLGGFVYPQYECLCLVLLYTVLSCTAVALWRHALFWWGNGEGVNLGQKGEGGWGHWEGRREQKVWSRCIVWEKNISTIIKSHNETIKQEKYVKSPRNQKLNSKTLHIVAQFNFSWVLEWYFFKTKENKTDLKVNKQAKPLPFNWRNAVSVH